MAHALEETAERLGLGADDWEPYAGWQSGKITWPALAGLGVLGASPPALADRGRLVLVTAVNPTPAGEGKTTTSIALADALRRIGRRSALALREPSLGPSLGQKGGGTGGGRAQLTPSDRINLHFTGDIHAITAANNLLSAVVDNHLHFGNRLGLDPRRIAFRRAIDMDDRALRHVVVGLGGPTGGVVREEEFVISAASEVMAVLALASSLDDLQARLGRMVVGFTAEGRPVTAGDLQVAAAMAALLADALRPNLVRTLEGTPALVHAGPFANIAHGTSSILAARLGLARAEVVVTEAGFGADLGAEKFFDLVAPVLGATPDAIVLVATVRALMHHGGADVGHGDRGDMLALERGLAHLGAHLDTLARTGVPVVVALNRFDDDRDEEVERIAAYCQGRGAGFAAHTAFRDGGGGAIALGEAVLAALDGCEARRAAVRPFYPPGTPTLDALERVARDVYGAAGVDYSRAARQSLRRFADAGYGDLPVCVAKTQYSITDDPQVRGVPAPGWRLTLREARLSAGAGFVVALTGEILTMPGLPRDPQALAVRVTPEGEVVGIR
jgi:formate--tetrahydrofolate ligase